VCARFSASFNGAMMRVCWCSGAAEGKKGKLFSFFLCGKRGVFKNEKRETTIDRSIDRQAHTRFSRLFLAREKERIFKRRRRAKVEIFFFLFCLASRARLEERTKRRTRAYIQKQLLSFCFSFTFRTRFYAREREREREKHARQTPRAHFFKGRREEEDDDDDDEFKSTDERTRVYIVHLHGRDDEKKKISKQSRGCSFESDE
jgi:hypothetical protein